MLKEGKNKIKEAEDILCRMGSTLKCLEKPTELKNSNKVFGFLSVILLFVVKIVNYIY